MEWNHFLDALETLKISLMPNQENELRDLLDASGSRGKVDLTEFSALVGLADN